MRAIPFLILLMLASCASTRRQETVSSCQATADSVTMHHLEYARVRSDSLRLLTFVSIDSATLGSDTATLHLYGVKIARAGSRTVTAAETLNSDSVSRVTESALSLRHEKETIPTDTGSHPLRFLLPAAVVLIALIAFFRRKIG